MATYRSIASTETDPQAPVTSALVKALEANPTAIAEGATGAPVNQAAWHPFDMVNVGDGATGKIYDFATDGARASVTATFADGYDYLIRLVNLSGSTNLQPFRIGGTNVTANLSSADTLTGTIEILAPTLTNLPKWAMVNLRVASGSTGIKTFDGTAVIPFLGAFAFSSMSTALNSVALGYSTGNIDGGQIHLYRRRNFMFG